MNLENNRGIWKLLTLPRGMKVLIDHLPPSDPPHMLLLLLRNCHLHNVYLTSFPCSWFPTTVLHMNRDILSVLSILLIAPKKKKKTRKCACTSRLHTHTHTHINSCSNLVKESTPWNVRNCSQFCTLCHKANPPTPEHRC